MECLIEDKYKLMKANLLLSKETNPIRIVKRIMQNDYINMHGPEHHFLDGGALMVAMRNAGLEMDLEANLDKLASRAIMMPGAMCGYWGVCGSVASIGAVFSVLDNTGPLSNDIYYSRHMKFTSSVIEKMSLIGGPRCCKRNAFLSIREGIKYANEHYHLAMEIEEIKCEFSNRNNQCIGERCPFHNK